VVVDGFTVVLLVVDGFWVVVVDVMSVVLVGALLVLGFALLLLLLLLPPLEPFLPVSRFLL
jgi:hypothetical protein